VYPALSQVALRLMSIHPTSAATERNWSLWGRVYTASRSQLGLERAKALTTFCFNDRQRVADQRDFDLLLSLIEGEYSEGDAESQGPSDPIDVEESEEEEYEQDRMMRDYCQ
jgi:hypothetical protein